MNRNNLLRVVAASTLFFAATISPPIFAQEHVPDQHTLLLLHFTGNLSGAQGETPTQAQGVAFEPGIFGDGAYFSPGNQVYFPRAGNINSTEGTLEFWIKPRWNGNDGQGRVVLRHGVAGGMLFFKDGGNYWRIILNRFGSSSGPEIDTGINVGSEWRADQWHHCAFTWNNESLKLYVDGELRTTRKVTIQLPTVNDASIQFGADGFGGYLDAVIDELRISDIARSAQEIRASFLAGISVSTLAIQPDSIVLLETWRKTPTLVASTNFGTMNIPPAAAQWHSSNSVIASIDGTGRITAHSAGKATITASFQNVQAAAAVTVTAPILPPLVEQIDPYLAAPAPNHLFEMPVVILRYFPTRDGVNVDPIVSDWHSTLAELRAKIDRDAIHTKFMLEEGSRFRGYKDPTAPPSLGYRVLHIVTVFEEMPPGFPAGTPGIFAPDYDQIITRFGAENFVENLGVKEFWIWGYHHGNIAPAESNMSSPTTGDISNSHRFNDDLPIFNRTYTLYNYNFTRGPNEDVHNHGHQLEAILSYVNQRQDGNTDLFWKKFVGQNANGNFITGRCGWTHMPPNTTNDYDYYNNTLVTSDIEDWTPDRSGVTKLVNAQTWGNIAYAWPNNDPPGGQTEAQWYIYWMQNMPGRGNGIRHGQNFMTNWWKFTGDWDGSIKAELGLYQSTPTSIIEVALQSGSVLFGDTLTIPLHVSTESLLSLGQVVVEYDSTLLQFVEALPGTATAGFTLITNTGLSFGPSTPGMNKNVLVQVSGPGTFSGSDQEIILLRMRAILEVDTTTTLFFDRTAGHTFFVTADGIEVSSGRITFTDGEVTIATDGHDLSGVVKYLESGISISGTSVELRHALGASFDTTDSQGSFAFSAIRKDSVHLSLHKQGDWRDAITGADAMLALRSLAFLETLTASRKLAADVNENDSVSGADAVALLRYLAFLPVAFGHPGEWRFLPPDTGFVLLQNSELAFSGYLLGDVTLDWGVATGVAAARRAAANHDAVAIARLHLPELNAPKGDTVAIAVHFSSDSAMSFVQFTVAYDSTALQYLETQIGPGANDMGVLVNPSPPFVAQILGTNQEIVVQFSSATHSIFGPQQELVRLVMKVVGEEGREAPLVFDSQPRRTLMTTVNFADASGAAIEGIAGKITIRRATAVNDRREPLPTSFELHQNYPNPFNPETEIRFALPQTSHVVLKIFNVLGEEVRTLVNEQREAGYHAVRWDGKDKNRNAVASGVYLYQLQAGSFSQVKKMSFIQ